MSSAIAALSQWLCSTVEEVGRSVVRVEGGDGRPASGLVIGSRQGVTTARAMSRDQVTLGLDDRELRGRVRGRDEATDLALIELAGHGRVRRSDLVFQLQPLQLPGDVRQLTGEELGLLVTGVEQGGPAAKAGVQFGDTVLHLGDDSMTTRADLYRSLRADHAGEQVPLTYFRDGRVAKVQVTLGGR